MRALAYARRPLGETKPNGNPKLPMPGTPLERTPASLLRPNAELGMGCPSWTSKSANEAACELQCPPMSAGQRGIGKVLGERISLARSPGGRRCHWEFLELKVLRPQEAPPFEGACAILKSSLLSSACTATEAALAASTLPA